MPKPRIKVEEPENPDAENDMPPPPPPVLLSSYNSKRRSNSKSPKRDGVSVKSHQTPTLLGSDLVPIRSEFKLKRDLDVADRGRPMVDWIRRQSAQDSGNYSAGSSPKVLEISQETLEKHNLSSDAWLALRGQVYDVTDYISFHPGGVREIMKGVGKDATALFNSIHRYVNFESILKGKQVGVYAPNRRASIASADGAPLVVTNLPANKSGQDGKVSCFQKTLIGWYSGRLSLCFGNSPINEYDDELIPSTKFREDKSHCFYTVNLKNLKFTEDYWTASILEKNTLLLKVITTPPEMWVGYYKLRDALLNDSISIAFSDRFRTMTLKIEKPSERRWHSIGNALPDNNLILDSRHTIDDRNPCRQVLRQEIARDMYLIAVEVSASARIGVPIGFDVKLTAVKENVSRRYTPIPMLFHRESYKVDTENEVLYFVIKVYPDGRMTQILKRMELNQSDLLQVGYSCGNFNTDWLHGADTYFLFAAGSGITPFFGILNFYLEHNIAIGVSHVVLIHWSKEEADLVWSKELDNFHKAHSWFKFIPVLTQLSSDEDSWSGLRGRISVEQFGQIINTIPGAATKKNRVRFMTCGPEGFNCAVCEAIEQSKYPLDSTFVFLG